MDYNVESYLSMVTLAEVEEVKFVGKDIDELIKTLKGKETNPDAFAKDMSYLCMLVCVRGTSMTKLMDRSSPEAKRKIEGYVRKYGIVPHLKTVPMKTPTLPRIASLFPLLISEIREKFNTNVPNIGDDNGLPKRYWFPGGGALMTEDTLPLWLEWYASFCRIVKIGYSEENASLSYKFSRVMQKDRYSA